MMTNEELLGLCIVKLLEMPEVYSAKITKPDVITEHENFYKITVEFDHGTKYASHKISDEMLEASLELVEYLKYQFQRYIDSSKYHKIV